ncbi:uncharacterized protein LOC113331570 [Papaver somniferum]|uniref:uncharacterized protein LOC113331570 n=1 Tax=Papaver somniferum TaxID=3469 RepID=UPI000E6F791F|nr:uncharacterized protein LOC113331570 [Papaver somniferum]
MPTTSKLQSNLGEKSVDHKLYRSMIESLLYLTTTRPDIAFSVGCCAIFQADPKESHLKVVKRIIRYVCGTVDYGLSYSMDTNNSLFAYSDADWEGCVEDRKSTSGVVSMLVKTLLRGIERNRTHNPYQPVRQNTLLLVHAVPSYYG